MEYKKINAQSYNIHFIKTDKFKKVKIRINFKELIDKEKIVYRNMLSLILLEATKAYPTRRLLDIECENLYNIGVSANVTASGNYNIMQFSTSFLNEKYTEKNMLDNSVKFFLDFIFEPYIENDKFNEQAFNNAKNIMIDEMESYNDNPGRYAFSRLYEEMCPNSVIRYRNIGYMEDLEKLTNEKLYEYYKELLKNNFVDIFVIGDIDIDEVTKIIKKYFDINTIKKNSISHFIEQKEFRKKSLTVKDKKSISQSILLLGSKIKDITDFERKYVLPLYNQILGGSPDSKLFREVREKNSLCYSISSTHSGVASLEYVIAGIDKENFDKTLKIVKKEVKKMEDGDFKEEQLEQAKIAFLASLKEIEDDMNAIINIYEAHEYLDYDLLDEREKNIKLVTKKDIINASKKIKLDTIYLLEGEMQDEEEN